MQRRHTFKLNRLNISEIILVILVIIITVGCLCIARIEKNTLAKRLQNHVFWNNEENKTKILYSTLLVAKLLLEILKFN